MVVAAPAAPAVARPVITSTAASAAGAASARNSRLHDVIPLLICECLLDPTERPVSMRVIGWYRDPESFGFRDKATLAAAARGLRLNA